MVASTVLAAIALLRFGEDFRIFYAAARVVLAGGNPYDYHTLDSVLLTLPGGTGGIGNKPYYYAPWFAWSIIPLAWLPFSTARALWMLLNLALWDFSLWQLANLLRWPKTGWRRWLFFLLVTVVFAWITWRFEQTGILLFALLIGALLALRNDDKVLAGVWLALLLIKPNITLIPVTAITLWLIRHRNWQTAVTLGALNLGLLVAASIVTPTWYQPFLEPGFGRALFRVINGPGQIMGARINTTLSDWLAMFQLPAGIIQMVSVAAVITGLTILIIITWKSDSLLQVTAASLLTGFAITPYALQYDYPSLTLVFFLAIALWQFRRQRWMAKAGAVIVLLIASVPIWEGPISDGYWMVLGLIGLALWSWYTVNQSQVPQYLL